MTKKKQSEPVRIHLNSEQRAVVDAREGFWNVQAGPGSGKSTTLIQRYVRLIQEGEKPEDILSLSFTKAAAKNLSDRAEAILGVQKMDRCAGFSTFHSLALSFCTAERENFPFKLAEFPLCTEAQANKIAWEAGKRFEVDVRSLRPWISLQKRSRITPNDAVTIAEKESKNEKLALAYKQYERAMRENGVLDFDSLISEMVNLLLKKPDILDRWSYVWIMADECQDTDSIQWELLRLLSSKHGNLMCVGDAGQNLYSFRGSDADTFLHMERMFPNTRTLYLAKNHRSTPQVVGWCKMFGPVPDLAERFHTENPDGPDPVITGFPSSADEAQSIVQYVQKMELSQLNEIAVLARTNAALRPVEDALSVAGVKYHYQGRSGYWNQPEVQAVIAHLSCAISLSDHSVLTCLRSPFWPTKFLKKKEISDEVKNRQKGDPNKPSVFKLLSEYRSSDTKQTQGVSSFIHFLVTLRRYANVEPKKALTSVMQDLRAEDYYTEEATADNNPVENLKELVKISGRFTSIKEFLDYSRRASAASKQKKGLCLSTCHAAKGLEWETVFLIAVQDGILPHSRSESLGEEKNVFFVGISRAKRNLFVSYAGSPSSFIRPLIPRTKQEQELDQIFEGVFANAN